MIIINASNIDSIEAMQQSPERVARWVASASNKLVARLIATIDAAPGYVQKRYPVQQCREAATRELAMRVQYHVVIA